MVRGRYHNKFGDSVSKVRGLRLLLPAAFSPLKHKNTLFIVVGLPVMGGQYDMKIGKI